jgi:hypothetical protein
MPKPSLAASLKSFDNRPSVQLVEEPKANPEAEKPPAPKEKPKASVAKAVPTEPVMLSGSPTPARAGKQQVAFWVDRPTAKRLRLLSVEVEKTSQSLMEEALEALLLKYGK